MGTQGTDSVIRIKISGQTCPDSSNIFVNRWNAGASPLCYGSTVTDVRNMSPGEVGKKRGLTSKLGYLYPSSSQVYIPDDVINSTSSNSNIVKNMWKMGYVDNYGKHYLKLKCQNKGTATITLQVYSKSTDKGAYSPKKTFKFKINVK